MIEVSRSPVLPRLNTRNYMTKVMLILECGGVALGHYQSKLISLAQDDKIVKQTQDSGEAG